MKKLNLKNFVSAVTEAKYWKSSHSFLEEYKKSCPKLTEYDIDVYKRAVLSVDAQKFTTINDNIDHLSYNVVYAF